MPPTPRSRAGFIAVGLFLFFAASTASFGGLTLIFPGTILDRAWKLNPRAYAELVAEGRIAGVPFLFLAFILALAGVGWFRHRWWAWYLAFVMVGTQVLANLISIFVGYFFRGSAGLVIASALLLYLARPTIRAVFTD